MSVFRNPRSRRAIRTLTTAAVAASAAAAVAVVGTGSASALSIPLTLDATAHTTVAKLGLTTSFPTTTMTGEVAFKAGPDGRLPLTSTLELPQATTDLKVGPVKLAAITMKVVDPETTGSVLLAGGKVNTKVSQKFKVQITSLVPLGLDKAPGSSTLNLVGTKCMTEATTADLSGDLAGTFKTMAGTLTGTYTIPAFHNCGALTDVLTTLVSGDGNTLSVDLRPHTTA